MQENTEPEKPEDAEIPENLKEKSDEEITPESIDSPESDPQFEEQEGEVLPPEKKKNNGCGFVLFFLLLLGGGGGYLFYTDQVPAQIKQWVKPYYQTAHEKLFGTSAQEQAKVKSIPAPPPSEQWTSQVEEQSEAPVIQKKSSVVEQKVEVIPTPSTQESASKEEHISGSDPQPSPKIEELDSNFPAEISGNSTSVEPELKTILEKPKGKTKTKEPEEVEIAQAEEIFVPPVPVVEAPPILFAGEPEIEEGPVQPKENEKSEAVQAYLDFFESTLVKIGELIKTGFSKVKDFLIKSLD